jgi:glycosyltransferase involved in cell wall biosynthesis
MSDLRSRIVLVTEGGYPFVGGGVSVWCDQVVSSMPERDFHLVALTGSSAMRPAFDLPPNVVGLTTVPIWAPTAYGSPPRRRAKARFLDIYSRLLAGTLSPQATAQDFALALRALYEYAQTENLGAALRTEDAVRTLVDAWDTWPPGGDDAASIGPVEPSLADAALVTLLFENMLRPLSIPPVEGDMVHCTSNGLVGLVALGAHWSRANPIVVSEHGLYLRERYLAHRDTTYGWAVKSALLLMTRAITGLVYAESDVVVPGNIYNRRWQLKAGADPDSIVTVYNGVDPDHFPVSAAEPNEPTLVFVGRIDPIKDVETLLHAFALVVSEIPAARLRLFGVASPRREDYLERCRALAGELGLDQSVTFEGRASAARDAYAAGQVVVLSSISEGFPYTVIEAMSSGRPTVSTNVGGVAEAVGDTGLVVPPRSPRAFADACIALLRDDVFRARLGAEARTRVLDMFTLERSMTALGSIYDGVLSEKREVVDLTSGRIVSMWERSA